MAVPYPAAAFAHAAAAAALVPDVNVPNPSVGRTLTTVPGPPTITIVQGDILRYPLEAVVVVTDGDMQIDRQAIRSKNQLWHKWAGPGLDLWNRFVHYIINNNAAVIATLNPSRALRVPCK